MTYPVVTWVRLGNDQTKRQPRVIVVTVCMEKQAFVQNKVTTTSRINSKGVKTRSNQFKHTFSTKTVFLTIF